MSALQRSFAKTHLQNLPPPPAVFDEAEEDAANDEHPPLSKNGSSSSASSTGTITASADKNLFERPSVRQPRSQYEPLPWQNFFEQELFLDADDIRSHAYFTPPESAEAPLFCFHHGAGASGLSFALLTSALKTALPEAGFLSPDCRGHGQTTTTTSKLDLSLETLAADLAFAVNATSAKLAWPKLPPIVLLGHSLGGAVVTELAHKSCLEIVCSAMAC